MPWAFLLPEDASVVPSISTSLCIRLCEAGPGLSLDRLLPPNAVPEGMEPVFEKLLPWPFSLV